MDSYERLHRNLSVAENHEHALRSGIANVPLFLAWSLGLLLCGFAASAAAQQPDLYLNEEEYFEAHGLSVLAFNNWYSGNFGDQKLSGIELIHHGKRTATNGDVRLSNTPEQWDPIPAFSERTVDTSASRIQASLSYPNYNFNYRIDAEPKGDDNYSGRPDDRLAFTSKSTPLDYGSIAALAAASRVLPGYNDALAQAARETAIRVWNEEQNSEPTIFRHGNTTGGPLEVEELKATVELLITTDGDRKYARHLKEMWPYLEENFSRNASLAVRALPYMNEEYAQNVERAVNAYAKHLDGFLSDNPFGVPITTGGWGGSGTVLRFAMQNYILHEAFPDIVGPEHTLRGLNYVLGTHPASSVSMVSGIGTDTQTITYGINRADFSFIPGGVVPGVVIVNPDFPELQEDWPFLWFENEYVIPEGALYIYVANAAGALMGD